MGRNLKEGEVQAIAAGGQGAQLSLQQLQALASLFGGTQGGIGQLLQGSIQKLLATPATNPTQTRTGRISDQVNLGNAQDLGGQFGNLTAGLDQLSGDVLRGRTASSADLNAIHQAGQGALQAGLADITNFRDQGLQALRTELAPARGLRPNDTPIVDRGGQIVAESNRAADQLSGQIRSQEAQQQLQFPLQRQAADIAALGLQGQFATGQQQFLTALQQQALQNRLALSGALSSTGLNLAGLGLNTANTAGRALGNVYGGAQNQGTSTLSQIGQGVGIFGGLAGGVGGLIGGIGSLF